MKNLMKVAFGISFVALTSLCVAQPDNGGPRPHKMDAQGMTDRMAQDLNLTPDQKAKVLEIHKSHMAKMDSLRKVNENNREALRAERRKIDDVNDAKYKAILTPEQYTKYLEAKLHRGGKEHGEKPQN